MAHRASVIGSLLYLWKEMVGLVFFWYFIWISVFSRYLIFIICFVFQNFLDTSFFYILNHFNPVFHFWPIKGFCNIFSRYRNGTLGHSNIELSRYLLFWYFLFSGFSEYLVFWYFLLFSGFSWYQHFFLYKLHFMIFLMT